MSRKIRNKRRECSCLKPGDKVRIIRYDPKSRIKVDEYSMGLKQDIVTHPVDSIAYVTTFEINYEKDKTYVVLNKEPDKYHGHYYPAHVLKKIR